jgi:hypothetical protein
MSEKSDFYLTLMSNSSFKDYPENKTSSYSVNLPKHVTLDGSWSCCIAELTYPLTFENVTPNNNSFVIQHVGVAGPLRRDRKLVISIPEGHYANMKEVVKTLNDAVIKQMYKFKKEIFALVDAKEDFVEVETFIYDEAKHNVRFNPNNIEKLSEGDMLITVKSTGYVEEQKRWAKVVTENYAFEHIVEKVYLTGRLAQQLGFEPDTELRNQKSRGQSHVRFGIPPEMLVYCDIIEPQFFSDTYSQVLRLIPTLPQNHRFGDLYQRTFETRNYIPVMTKNFRTIKIDIRGSTGELMPFCFGTSCVVLHFKKN